MKFSVSACLPLKVIGFSYLIAAAYDYGYLNGYIPYYYIPEEPASATGY